jgi:hypothetical protein
VVVYVNNYIFSTVYFQADIGNKVMHKITTVIMLFVFGEPYH